VMSPTSALCLSTALLLALTPTTTNALRIGVVRSRATAHRCILQMMAADDAIRECLVDAENAGEQEACVEGGEVATNSADGALSWAPALPHDRTENLLGPHESLAECLWEAENPGEIAECRVDFEELLGVPTGECDSETEVCNPEDIRTKEQREAATVRTSSATMSLCGLVGPEARFGPGKCIFRGDKCTGKRCKVNNAPCKVNHSS